MSNVKDFILGYRDLSDDPEIHFMKDRVGGSVVFIPATIAASALTKKKDKHDKRTIAQKIKDYPKDTVKSVKNIGSAAKKAVKNPKVMVPTALAGGAALGVHYLRGNNLAKTNGVDFGLADTILTSTVPLYSADVAVKNKMRKKREKNASEIIDELYKEAGFKKEIAERGADHVLYKINKNNPVAGALIENPAVTVGALTVLPLGAGYVGGNIALDKRIKKHTRKARTEK